MSNKMPEIKKISLLKPSEVLPYFNVTAQGLSSAEAGKRRQVYGENILTKKAAVNPLKQFLKQFTHYMAVLLWIAGFLAIIAGMPEIAYAAWAVIVINALFAFIQEYKADKALAELAQMLPNRVKVYREGKLAVLQANELTVGDVIVLEAGDSVPADARLTEAIGLFLDNSLLNGESVPVDRSETEFDLSSENITESPNFVFAGTMVTEGKAKAVVFAVGSQTEIGKVSKLTQAIKRGESTLEIQVQKIVKFITKVALALGLIAFSIAVFGAGLDFRVGFIFAIGIIVANIPEGLLPIVSLTLAIGIQRMAKQNALIKRLLAVESLSAASVICTDKTGTLTENQMTVRKIWTLDTSAEISGTGYEKAGDFALADSSKKNRKDLIAILLTAAAVCSEAAITDDESNPLQWHIIGSPTEAALLIAGAKYGISADQERKNFKRLSVIPFSSERKKMTVEVLNLNNHLFKPDTRLIFTNGAPLAVISSCKFIFRNGILTEIDDKIRQLLIRENDNLSAQGYRVLGLCYTESAPADPSAGPEEEKQNIFLGLAAMVDPPRPEVYNAIKQCTGAGIKVTIITGDYGLTAAAIARQIGLDITMDCIITGKQMEEMSDCELETVLSKNKPLIFSRTTPEHKLRIVETYKKLGEIVAVTGDGVNDTLALKSSHIGIAMGIGGTDVAREAADMILLDNNFATIVKAVEEGRSIYSNIRKFITYILASNMPEFMPFIAMILIKIPPALTILQILAIELGTDIVPALALGAEKPEKGILEKPPRKNEENLLNRSLFLRAYGYLGLIEGLISLAVFLHIWLRSGYSLADLQSISNAIIYHNVNADVARLYEYSTTMTLAAVIACQIGNVFLCRSEKLSIWQMFASKNNMIYFGLGFEALTSFAIIYLPLLAGVFQTQPILLSDYKILALCPVILILFEECRKFILRKIEKTN